MPDPRLDALAALVARVEGAAQWLASLATRAAVVGAAAGVYVWWEMRGDALTEWWQGTAGSLLVLAVCLAPALWLGNVRVALHDLVELPEKLGEVATRRLGREDREDRAPPPPRPAGGPLGAARTIWDAVRDYGDVAGSWATVGQLLAPPFWLITAAGFMAVPILVVVALVMASVT